MKKCKEVAKQFKNTCAHGDYDTPAISVSAMESERHVCERTRCINGGYTNQTTNHCNWKRKLCVTCFEDANGQTKIRIQSNNMPDHCVSSGNILPLEKNFDYEVFFNRKESPDNLVNNLATQTDLDSTVCPIGVPYDKVGLGIVEYGDRESIQAKGFALNGVMFQFANQMHQDPVSPIDETNEQPLDTCLGHNQRNSDGGVYHYHHLSPCLNADFLDGKDEVDECAKTDDCFKDISGWSRSGYEGKPEKTVIGISKYGHVMYGPYKNSGAVWGTDDVDACNGVWDGEDYVYVGTAWHPYLAGCQGPANKPQNDGLFPQCSKNGMEKYVSRSGSPVLGNSSDVFVSSNCPIQRLAILVGFIVGILQSYRVVG